MRLAVSIVLLVSFAVPAFGAAQSELPPIPEPPDELTRPLLYLDDRSLVDAPPPSPGQLTVRHGLIGAGMAIFMVSFGPHSTISLLVEATGDLAEGWWTGAVPVAGPIVQGVLFDVDEPSAWALLLFTTASQLSGLIMTIAGVVDRVEQPRRRSRGSPSVSADGAGLRIDF